MSFDTKKPVGKPQPEPEVLVDPAGLPAYAPNDPAASLELDTDALIAYITSTYPASPTPPCSPPTNKQPERKPSKRKKKRECRGRARPLPGFGTASQPSLLRLQEDHGEAPYASQGAALDPAKGQRPSALPFLFFEGKRVWEVMAPFSQITTLIPTSTRTKTLRKKKQGVQRARPPFARVWDSVPTSPTSP